MSAAEWATCSAGLTSAALTLRGLMLRPRHPAWRNAPRLVRTAILVAGAIFGGVAVDLARSHEAGVREGVAYTAIALPALVLLIHMRRPLSTPPKPEGGRTWTP